MLCVRSLEKIGKIAPKKFSVETKTATIGIRGTNFSIVAGKDGIVNAYCTYGAISAKVKGVEYIVKQGYFISILADGSVEIKEFSSDDLKKMKKKNFALNNSNKKSLLEKGDGVEDGYLELIAKDESKIIISDLDETNTDNILKKDLDDMLDEELILDPNEILTDSSIIAGYTMSSAYYSGSYTTSYTTGNLDSTGTADLDIDFGNDSANLVIGGDTMYGFTNVNSNTITGAQMSEVGIAEAKFYGETGNIVKGSFSYGESGTVTAEGTFSVETSQDLN